MKCDSFDVIIGIKISFFRVSVTIEPGRSLLQLPRNKVFEKNFVFCYSVFSSSKGKIWKKKCLFKKRKKTI